MAVALDDGRVVDGDAAALVGHADPPRAVPRATPTIGGVVHTHSAAATAWAQARRAIPPFGTTHADHFHGPVPVTRPLGEAEVGGRLRGRDRAR